MIEQTVLEISKWDYNEPSEPIEDRERILNFTSLDVQKKRNSQKKGLACRFTGQFVFEEAVLLEFVGEHSYVIDFHEVIDKNELLKMIRNSFTMFYEKFEFMKHTTVLQDRELTPLNESLIDLDAILPLLK